jgi:Flp pilus assembly protein TadG
MRKYWFPIIADTKGAVAPLVAISLFAFVGAAGVAFDYARVAALDTELQNAADQAALAAATQLDGKAGATVRATAAAQTLLKNNTYFANDGGSSEAAVASVRFYQSYDNSTETLGPEATGAQDAKVVRVEMAARQAAFAFTPIVQAITTQSLSAKALAGLNTAVCRVPPLMICNPNETIDPTFSAMLPGSGLLVGGRAQTSDAYAPGNIGFLNTGYAYSDTAEGKNTLIKALAQQNSIGACVAWDSVTTEPGASSPVLNALNTRFDVYANNVQQTDVCGLGQCPPSPNVRKDIVREAPTSNGQGDPISNQCTPKQEDSNGKGWKLPDLAGRYLPPANRMLTEIERSKLLPMGHPRDICHATEVATCTGGREGNGVWDRDAYFQSNYGWDAAGSSSLNGWPRKTGLPLNVTRYETYLWELKSENLNLKPGGLAQPVRVDTKGKDASPTWSHGAPVCQTRNVSAPRGNLDRRRLTLAVVNCNAERVTGRTKVKNVQKWIDVFYVEPSWDRDRTRQTDVYVELIGEASVTGSSGETNQIQRSVPYLIR